MKRLVLGGPQLHPLLVGAVAWFAACLAILLYGDLSSAECGRELALSRGVLGVILLAIPAVGPALVVAALAISFKMLCSPRFWGGLIAAMLVIVGIAYLAQPNNYYEFLPPVQCRIDL